MDEQLIHDLDNAKNGRRALAFILDLIIVTSIALFLSSIVGLFKPMDSPSISLLSSLPIIIVALSYYVFMPVTIGKYAVKIKVYDLKSNSKPRIYQNFIRLLLLMVWPIEAIVILVNKNNRRLGDMLASTQVFQTDTNQKWYLRLVYSVVIMVFCMYFNIFMMGIASKNTNIYKSATQHIIEKEIGKDEFGEAIKFGTTPRNIEVVNNEGIVVLPAQWQDKEGYIVVRLNRIDSTWSVVEMNVTEESISNGFSYTFNIK